MPQKNEVLLRKKYISPEKYEKMLEYNRNYYANMSPDKKEKYLEYKRLYHHLNRDLRRARYTRSPKLDCV